MKRLALALTLSLVAGLTLVRCGAGSSDTSRTADALASNGVTATLSISSDWGAGYCANVLLLNAASAPASGWAVLIDLNGSTLSQLWSGSYAVSDGRLTVQPLSWNETLAAGSSTTFGFCGSGSGRPTLASFTINGGSSSADAGAPDSGAQDGGGGGLDGGTADAGAPDAGADGGMGDGGTNGGADGGADGTVSCASQPVWNSQVVYNTAGEQVEYNCKLYKNQGFAYNVNPETNNGQYYPWLLVGSCSESNCAMGEGPWVACGQWDKWTSGAYTLYNDIWGSGAGPQCITAWSGSHFTVHSTQPATSGVKSYPNSGFVNLGRTIGSLGSFTSSFDIAVPTSGDWEATYDIWVPTEVMVWMYTSGNVGPIAAAWDSNGKPIPSATNITVGGHTWNVYRQNGGSNVISFVRTTNTTSGTVDIKALLGWARNQGWIPDGTIGAVQFGFEISGTGNAPMDFTCNSFSISAN